MSRAAPSHLSSLEKAVLVHVAVLLLASSWIYGGNIWWMRTSLSIWASLGAGITIIAFCQDGSRGRDARRKAWWLAPLALFTLFVFISAANPSFRPVHIGGQIGYVRSETAWPHWPSTISPAMSMRAWWFDTGVYLAAFNLVIILRSRTSARGIMTLIAVNTLLLSIMGTLQKLARTGFYFGSAESPNPRFFATFIYYNHWGAFMILGLTTAAGLLFYLARRYGNRDLWHSPFSLALIGILLIATSAPVSASRASTIIATVVMAAVLAHGLVYITRRRKERHLTVWPPLVFILLLSSAATGSVGWLSYKSLNERYADTQQALEQGKSVFGGRKDLYDDTWKLASQQPLYGWGLDTYSIGFQIIRPYTVNLRDRTQNVYANAHSDWLQSLAETGFVGTSLLILSGLFPLLALSIKSLRQPLVVYPLSGCALVLIYAWIEFPFGNSAVFITFWVLFFSTIRYAELTMVPTTTHST